jgi:UDP-glucose 4-epimerase
VRIVVTGGTGNVGTSCLQLLAEDRRIDQLVGIARRAPERSLARTDFVELDVSRDALDSVFETADVVVHLAWDLRPSHDRGALWRNNVEGSARVFETAARCGVQTLIYASSLGVYSPGTRERVDESWPREGIPGSSYSVQKAAVEKLLDRLEVVHPSLRVVRFRPALVFKREAASGIHRLFLGSLVPAVAFRPGAVPFVPRALRLQCVHSLDVADAICRAWIRPVRGAFNLAAEPVLDSAALARLLESRSAPVPGRALKALLAAAWSLRIQPSEPGWIDLALQAPLISAERARRELDWNPRHDAEQTLLELLDGLRNGAGLETPRLHPRGITSRRRRGNDESARFSQTKGRSSRTGPRSPDRAST